MRIVSEQWERGICYLRIPAVDRAAAERVASAVVSFGNAGVSALLLDLRGAGGVDYDAAAR
ncbi:MAG: hypothetical protein ACO4CZ_18740, partial [Planctomycetota bacterium]